MKKVTVVSVMPYKILPARLGGEKGIALFSEYVGKEVALTGVGTRSNEIAQAKNYKIIPLLSDRKIRYANVFLYFSLRRIIKEEKATHLLIEHPYYGWLAWLIRKTTSVIWVVHSHNIEFERSRSIGRWWWKALQWYETWVYKKADFTFFISEDDLQFAIEHMKIDRQRAAAVTYGVEISERPKDKDACKREIAKIHGFSESTKILLFNGTLAHHSNYDAVTVITDKINPSLSSQPVPYRIIVCGKGLPDSFQELKEYSDKNIIYAGFVPDISVYFKAADIFLNPIMSGAGIKTKAVEAIAYDCDVISTELGALGIVRETCSNKLEVVKDGDWDAFTTKTIERLVKEPTPTPSAFYDYYDWRSIARKVKRLLEESTRR